MTSEQLKSLEPKEQIFAELLMEISGKLKRLADLLDRELTETKP